MSRISSFKVREMRKQTAAARGVRAALSVPGMPLVGMAFEVRRCSFGGRKAVRCRLSVYPANSVPILTEHLVTPSEWNNPFVPPAVGLRLGRLVVNHYRRYVPCLG